MNIFVITLIAIFGCFSTAPTGDDLQTPQLQFNLLEFIRNLMKLGREWVCAADVDQIIEKLHLPDGVRVRRTVKLAQTKFCGEREQEKRSVDLKGVQVDSISELFKALNSLPPHFVCEVEVSQLLALLELPEHMSNTVTTARLVVCRARGY